MPIFVKAGANEHLRGGAFYHARSALDHFGSTRIGSRSIEKIVPWSPGHFPFLKGFVNLSASALLFLIEPRAG